MIGCTALSAAPHGPFVGEKMAEYSHLFLKSETWKSLFSYLNFNTAHLYVVLPFQYSEVCWKHSSMFMQLFFTSCFFSVQGEEGSQVSHEITVGLKHLHVPILRYSLWKKCIQGWCVYVTDMLNPPPPQVHTGYMWRGDQKDGGSQMRTEAWRWSVQ